MTASASTMSGSSAASLLVVVLVSLLSIQGGSGEESPLQVKPRSAINCTVAGMRYPLYTGCQGSLQCGRNSATFRQNCPAERCYNYSSNRCNIQATEPNSWFDCTVDNHGKMLPYIQSPRIYGLCLKASQQASPAVVFLNHCPENMTFTLESQSCG